MVVLSGIMIQNLKRETGWHLRGTRRVGVSHEDVEIVQQCVSFSSTPARARHVLMHDTTDRDGRCLCGCPPEQDSQGSRYRARGLMSGLVTLWKTMPARLLLTNTFNPIIDADDSCISSLSNPKFSRSRSCFDCLILGNLSIFTDHSKSSICALSRPRHYFSSSEDAWILFL